MKHKTVSRPTEEKALSNWQKFGCQTKPKFLPDLEDSRRNKLLHQLSGQIAIAMDPKVKVSLDWTTLLEHPVYVIRCAPLKLVQNFPKDKIIKVYSV